MPKIKYLYSTFKIEGVNLDNLIKLFKRRNINIYEYKKRGRTAYITTNYADNKKIFAISKELCYNITKIKVGGLALPLYFAVKNIGLIIGAIIFVLLTLIFNNLVLKIEVSGSGANYKAEVVSCLQNLGVKKYSYFYNHNLKGLELELLKNSKFSFASLKREGNTLKVVVENNNSAPQITQKIESLKSPVKGVIHSIKTYRGIQLKEVGDSVEIGEEIVSGKTLINGVLCDDYVLAEVVIIAESEFTLSSQKQDASKYALIFAKELLQEFEIVSENVEVAEGKNSYLYTAKIKYKYNLYIG